MTITSESSYEDIAYVVCTAFHTAGVVAVLSGGGAAVIYAPAALQTRDLDFVLPMEIFGMPSLKILTDLGFASLYGGGTYAHPAIPFTLEIMEGPLGVGDETVQTWNTMRKGAMLLHIIRPLDSVKDRLAAAIHYKDLNSARQASEVAKRCPIDLREVKRWCNAEGDSATYDIFETFLTN